MNRELELQMRGYVKDLPDHHPDDSSSESESLDEDDPNLIPLETA